MTTYSARVWWHCDKCGLSGDTTNVEIDPDSTVSTLAGWHNCRSAS